ncbi:MAG: PQQ-dependent sugar dehydrogenase [Deinococcus sp.]|nr:PQQ-dependent sugar dehydrogenase [Deinococcus sp.]
MALEREIVATGLNFPVGLATPPGDSRLFVVEKAGRVQLIKDGNLVQRPFLDLTEQVGSTGNEQGLLAVVFHPDYAANGRLFVHYTDLSGNTVVSEFQVSTDPDVADPTSEKITLQVKHRPANHNGGQIAFGPEGYLYIALGDGGGSGDPFGNGQNPHTLLGKILRIDVDSAEPYGIPPDNPFVGTGQGLGEIWVYGLRNPWRFSFDRETGDLWIGDVGQESFEEIDLGVPGGNYGWSVLEGNHCYLQDDCDQSGFVAPVLEYSHNVGQAVIGGYVYRGMALPGWQGTYFYADFISGVVRSFRYVNGVVTDQMDHTRALGGLSITSFGEDAQGELYLVTVSGTRAGSVYRIVAH